MKPEKLLTFVGSGIFAVVAVIRLVAIIRGDWYLLPLLIQAVMASYLLVCRNESAAEARMTRRIIAWMLMILPLMMDISQHNLLMEIISFLGISLSVWALGTMGKSFGIAPADRGLVDTGPYKWIRHPMYLGEALSYGAILIPNHTFFNACIFAVIVMGIILRIWFEEQVVSGYGNYLKVVRYRLIPYIW